jgi:hypothetical protein
MHQTALDAGRLFFECYWREGFDRVLDVGASDVGGSFPTLRAVAPPGATYIGADMVAGGGVDFVIGDPYSYPFPDGHFDAVVSTSCWEHDPMFWLTFLEGLRVLSSRGFLYVNAPSSGTYHCYPLDHWRFYPDAGVALELWGRRMLYPVRLIESFITDQKVHSFNDCVMVFTKDPEFTPKTYIQDFRTSSVFNARKGTVRPMEANASTLLNVQSTLRP